MDKVTGEEGGGGGDGAQSGQNDGQQEKVAAGERREPLCDRARPVGGSGLKKALPAMSYNVSRNNNNRINQTIR